MKKTFILIILLTCFGLIYFFSPSVKVIHQRLMNGRSIDLFQKEKLKAGLTSLTGNSTTSQTSFTSQSFQRFGSTGEDYGHDIKVDASGNRYLIGEFSGSVDFGGTTLTAVGDKDIFLIKQNANGMLIWANRIGGTGADVGYHVSLDATGNSYIACSFYGTATFSGSSTTLTTNGSLRGGLLAKFDNNGNFVFAKKIDGNGDDIAHDIVVDANGDFYASGTFQNTINLGSISLTSLGGFDAFLAKYDNVGNVLWAKSIGSNGTGNEELHGLHLDNQGNIYAIGHANGTINLGSTTLSSLGSRDVLLTKYSSNGNLDWIKLVGGTSYEDISDGLVIDDALYIAGLFNGTANFDGFSLSSNGDVDGFFVKIDTAGNTLWANQIGGSSDDYGMGISQSQTGNLLLNVNYNVNFG